MASIILKNVKYQRNDEQLLSNINLDILDTENLVIIPQTSADTTSAHALIKIIGGIWPATSGYVNYEKNNGKRIFIGYKNLEKILKKGVIIKDLLNSLINTQKISEENLREIKEIVDMFKIAKHKNTNELEKNELSLLNLLTLLIIKPRLILIDQLVLPGSSAFQLAILEYVKNYCDRYNIKLITASNDENVIKILSDRKIYLSNAKIIKDILTSRIENVRENDVDNKTKAFDLEDDILEALKSSYEPQRTFVNQKNNQQQYYQKVEYVQEPDRELIEQVTKALSDSFEDEINESMQNLKTVEIRANEGSLTNDLLTIKYESNLDDDLVSDFATNNFDQNNHDEDEEYYESKNNTSLNKKFTGSLEFEKEEIKQKTKRLNEESKDILEDIKISQSQKRENATKHFRYQNNFDAKVPTNPLMTNEFLSEIRETYAMRNALSEQIKSPDFAKLNPELQNKVYQNYDAADKLIKEIDPTGTYDPSKSNQHHDAHHTEPFETDHQPTITKMVFEEETIFTGGIEDEIDTENYRPTSKFTTNPFDEDTKSYTKKPTTFNDQEDFSYFDNEKPRKNKQSTWRDRFVKKETNQEKPKNNNYDYQPKHYETKSNPIDDQYIKPNKAFVTDDFDTYTSDLKSKKISNNYQNNFTRKTNVVIPTKKFKTSHFEPESTATKKIKTMPIKSRAKKNLIERLYDEAIEDSEIIQEFKEKKSK